MSLKEYKLVNLSKYNLQLYKYALIMRILDTFIAFEPNPKNFL